MPQAHVVVGLGYGDEGKGSWVDHLVRMHGIKQVVRFNGGAQAAHHVVTPDGIVHCFAQFGSGSFVPGTQTLLSRYMLIEPSAFFNEALALEGKGVTNPAGMVVVSENAPIITPFNSLLNRIQEVFRGSLRHGSCGLGIGLTQADVENLGDRALYVRDLSDSFLRDKLAWLMDRKIQDATPFATPENKELLDRLRSIDLGFYEELYRRFAASVSVVSEERFLNLIRTNDSVFEGAQGVMLDQRHGFFPYCTRSNTGFVNAEELLKLSGFGGDVKRVGLLRGYATRHGAGPLLTQDDTLVLPACHNATNPWQGSFRLGWFDAVAAKYAIEAVGGVDTLAITNLDRMAGLASLKLAVRYKSSDARFFDSHGIRVLDTDLDTLRERTKALSTVEPVYEQLSGWSKDSAAGGIENYLETISACLDRPIDAYSTTPDYRKIYTVI